MISRKQISTITEGGMTLQKFLEGLAEAAEQKTKEVFIELGGEQLARMRNEFKSGFLAPSKRRLREMLKVRQNLDPSELIALACEEVNSRGLPLVRFAGQVIMTQRGPVASPMPISLEPGEVNRDGALRKTAEVFHTAILNVVLEGFIYSELQHDLGLIEGALHTASSAERPELSSAEEAKLREELKSSLVDAKMLITEFGGILSTGQYL